MTIVLIAGIFMALSTDHLLITAIGIWLAWGAMLNMEDADYE